MGNFDGVGEMPDLDALLALGGLDERSDILKQQMARAQALRGQQGRQYRSPGGAAFGALAQAIRGIGGGVAEANADAGLGEIADQRTAGAGLFAKGAQGLGARPAGLLGLMTGDKTLDRVGQALLQGAEQDADRDALAGRVRQPHVKTPEELDGIDALADYRRAMTENLGKPRQGKAGDPLRDLKAKRLQLQNEAAERKLKGEGGDTIDIDAYTYKYSGRVPKGSKKAWDSFKAMDSITQKYGGLEKIPGIGYGQGGVAMEALPPDAQKFKQTGLSIINAYRNKLFGASLTAGEEAAFAQVASLGGRATLSQVANAVEILRRGFLSDVEESQAGAPDEVKERIFGDLGMPFTPKKSKKGEESGMAPDRKARLEELRAKKAAGELK